MAYKFTKLKKPLQFPVFSGNVEVIPEGAENVEIAFRQSPILCRQGDDKEIPLNVYRWKNRTYHG